MPTRRRSCLTRRWYSPSARPASNRTPSHSTAPSVTRSSPFRQRSRVVLPLPDAPMMPSTVRGSTRKLTPHSMRASPALLPPGHPYFASDLRDVPDVLVPLVEEVRATDAGKFAARLYAEDRRA